MTTENQIEVNLSELRKMKIMIGMPMYGGGATAWFAKSVMGLFTIFTRYGLSIQPSIIMNESLITRARNYVADEFMRSDCTHLLFVDADIEFDHDDVITLMHFAQQDDLDVVCGPYPKKNISWEKVKDAVDKGLADKDPDVLSSYTGDYVFNAITKTGEIDLSQPVEVQEAGTGFMLIKRDVFLEFEANHPELRYYPDHARSEEFSGKRKITGFFMDPIVNERHLSEDYFFCHEIRKLGRKVWIVPWIKLNHIGTYIFQGDLVAVLNAKMSATIKEKDAKKYKK